MNRTKLTLVGQASSLSARASCPRIRLTGAGSPRGRQDVCPTSDLCPTSVLFTLAAAVLLNAPSLFAVDFEDKTPGLLDLPEAPPGFEVKLFARDPLVRNPCSMAFDAKGRLFVGQGPQYRNPTPDTPRDSVLILLDTDGDGVADKTKVFATGFNCIQGLAWHGRDLWVGNSPDLTVVRDLDGDDEADEYVLVYTDLGNIEHGIHGLNWAPDGKLYMSKGNSKGLTQPGRIAPKPFRELWGVTSPPGAPDFPAPRTFKKGEYKNTYQDPNDDWGREGGVLRCDDLGKNLEIVARGMRNPWDITFDDGFNCLGTDNARSAETGSSCRFTARILVGATRGVRIGRAKTIYLPRRSAHRCSKVPEPASSTTIHLSSRKIIVASFSSTIG